MNALEGFVPPNLTRALNAFLDFCYIARQNIFTEDSLDLLDAALERFHEYREIFRESGVRPNGFSLPRQHALKHYHRHIQNFGAPNGLCSSITESKHITAVKKPWRRSNRYEALNQMLITNTRNDKLAAARADFSSRGMLNGTCLGETIHTWKEGVRTEDASNSEDEDDSSGPDGNGENGCDLDLEPDGGEDGGDGGDGGRIDPAPDGAGDNDDSGGGGGGGGDDGSPGPVDGPPIFSEVTLAQRKGMFTSLSKANYLTDVLT